MESRRTRFAGIGLLVAVAIAALPIRTASADGKTDKTILGYWKHIDEDTGKTQSIFKLFEYKGKLVGRIEKVFGKPGKPAQIACTECSGSQKNKPVAGLIFFWDFVPDEDEPRKWVDGQILNPEDGNTYHAEAELSEDGKTLKVFGYIRLLVKIGGSSVWQRPTREELQSL